MKDKMRKTEKTSGGLWEIPQRDGSLSELLRLAGYNLPCIEGEGAGSVTQIMYENRCIGNMDRTGETTDVQVVYDVERDEATIQSIKLHELLSRNEISHEVTNPNKYWQQMNLKIKELEGLIEEKKELIDRVRASV